MTDTSKRNGFSFDDDLMPIMRGKVELPNFKELDLSHGVAAIAAGGGLKVTPGVSNAKVPASKSSWGHWARYFLNTTQGGSYDGSGYVMFWENSAGRIGTFAICEHEKIDGSGADHRRGWHPGRCGKCGLDMTVDSSD